MKGDGGEEHLSEQRHIGRDPEQLSVVVVSSEFDDSRLQHYRSTETWKERIMHVHIAAGEHAR